MTQRYVVLGLARPRVAWFADVARWATGAALPVEFVKCVSAQEVRVRLASGRRFSAALVDSGAHGLDRDLLDQLRDAGVAVVVVEDGHAPTDWVALGAAAVLPSTPSRAEVLDVLATHAAMVDGVDLDPLEATDQPLDLARRGQLVAVTGPSGVGASSTAIALAQGLGAERRVVLADLCLVAEQALLHDARDVVPGLPELLDAHRGRRPDAQALADLTWHVEERGYDLLLGLRRATDWPTVRPKSLAAAVDGLRRAWEVVVADVDPVVEGEDETGSVDVEDRHLLARTVLAEADRVVVVARPGMKWLHGAIRVLADLDRLGVDPERLVPVVLGVGRRPKARAEVARAFAELAPRGIRDVLASPTFLPDRDPDLALRDGIALHASLVEPLAATVGALLDLAPPAPAAAFEVAKAPPADEPAPIKPGELGFFVDMDGEDDDLDGIDGEDAA